MSSCTKTTCHFVPLTVLVLLSSMSLGRACVPECGIAYPCFVPASRGVNQDAVCPRPAKRYPDAPETSRSANELTRAGDDTVEWTGRSGNSGTSDYPGSERLRLPAGISKGS